MFGSIAVAVVIGIALRSLDYPLAGEAVYWAGIVAFLAIWRGTPVSLTDERDVALERRASQLTLTLSAVILAVGASAARVATYLDLYDVPTAVRGALYGYVSVFVLFAVSYLWVRYRR
jgi:ABC-type arginine/histidine transport system permease subunit